MQNALDIRYAIDGGDRITGVSAGWRAFGAANAGSWRDYDAVTGRVLWEFITDPTTVHLYQVMLRRVRSQRQTTTVQFRCDSPAVRRLMALEVSPLDDNGVLFAVARLHETPRVPVELLDASGPREGLITMCSWCKAVRIDDDRWVEVEDAVRVLGLFDGRMLPGITHGMCAACHEDVLGTLDDLESGALAAADGPA